MRDVVERRLLYPQEERKPRPGIITQRRLPHPTVVPRKPVPKHYVVPDPSPAGPDHWKKMVQRAHRRWDVGTGANIRRATEAAHRAEPVAFDDELDKLVMIQVERQRRLQSLRSAPPVVKRLLGPKPVPPPVLDPLDEFLVFVNKGLGGDSPRGSNAASETKAYMPHRPKGGFDGPGMPTKMGLYYARSDY